MQSIATNDKVPEVGKTVLSEKELAVKLGISKWTVRRWRLKAGLPFFGTEGRIFYRLESVLKWIENEEERNSLNTLSSIKNRRNIVWQV